MQHVCVDSRFMFWDGRTQYTVEYSTAFHEWSVFKNDETGNRLWSKKCMLGDPNAPHRWHAAEVLDEYLKTL